MKIKDVGLLLLFTTHCTVVFEKYLNCHRFTRHLFSNSARLCDAFTTCALLLHLPTRLIKIPGQKLFTDFRFMKRDFLAAEDYLQISDL